jgi:hypothetical protein
MWKRRAGRDGSGRGRLSFSARTHIPLAEQPPLLRRIAEWLRPGDWFVAITWSGAWTGAKENWLGSGAPMWWSRADAATNREWIAQAGPTVEQEDFVPEGDGGHALAPSCPLPNNRPC